MQLWDAAVLRVLPSPVQPPPCSSPGAGSGCSLGLAAGLCPSGARQDRALPRRRAQERFKAARFLKRL